MSKQRGKGRAGGKGRGGDDEPEDSPKGRKGRVVEEETNDIPTRKKGGRRGKAEEDAVPKKGQKKGQEEDEDEAPAPSSKPRAGKGKKGRNADAEEEPQEVQEEEVVEEEEAPKKGKGLGISRKAVEDGDGEEAAQEEEIQEEDAGTRKGKGKGKAKGKAKAAEEEEEEEAAEDETPQKTRGGGRDKANRKAEARRKKLQEEQAALDAKTDRKKKRAQEKGKSLEERQAEAEQEKHEIPWYVELKGRYKTKNRDIHVDNLTITLGGQVLIKEGTKLSLIYGKRYGLVGRNGLGKSVLLRKIASRDPELNIPEYLKILHVEQEVVGDDTVPLQAVLQADIEREWLLKERDRLLELHKKEAEIGEYIDEELLPKSYTLVDVIQRLQEIESDKAEARASAILAGLGFTQEEIRTKPTKHYSGGWRMRISIARALFSQPDLLLLDEPNNHLDLEACIWLESYLSEWKKTLVCVSHDSSFLNEFVDYIIHLHGSTLTTYKGDYDTFVKVRAANRAAKKKKAEAQEKKKEQIKKFAERSRDKQGKSRLRLLEKMEEIVQDVDDPTLRFSFPDSGGLGPLPLKFKNVSFKYPGTDRPIFKNLSFGIDTDSRIALVGRNGSGKSTLMNLMAGDLEPTDGEISRDRHMRIARFHQHHQEQLPLDVTVMDYFKSRFGEAGEQEIRQHVARFGLTGKLPLHMIGTLSGGQKSRVVFAEIAWKKPHILLLDEPTNHLDTETIESLAAALAEYDGGVVLISHNQYMVELACNEIWVVGNQGVKFFDGTFSDYKKAVAKELGLTYV